MFNTQLMSGCQFPSSKCWKLMFNVHQCLSAERWCSMFSTPHSGLTIQRSKEYCSMFTVQYSMLFNVQVLKLECRVLNTKCWLDVLCSLFFVLCSPLSVQCSTLKHQCWRLVEGWSSCCLLCDAFLLAVEASYHQTMKLCVTPVFLGTSVPSWDSCKWY